jgi:hypothetical protein
MFYRQLAVPVLIGMEYLSGKKRCQKHRQDTFVLDTAFTLIDGASWVASIVNAIGNSPYR